MVFYESVELLIVCEHFIQLNMYLIKHEILTLLGKKQLKTSLYWF